MTRAREATRIAAGPFRSGLLQGLEQQYLSIGAMMIQRRTTLAQAIAAVLAGAGIAVALPQDVLAQDASAPAASLEEVVVTAQRREQALQDVPIAIQVVGNELLNDVAAEDMGDLNGFVPGLVISSDSPTQPRYAIRGIQTGDFGVGTDPAVGVYVDGVYAARSGASLLAFNDIERIESPERARRARCSVATAPRVRSRS